MNNVFLMEEHPSGTIVQLFLMDAPPREGRNLKLCLLSSALSSASMLVSELASGIRLLEINLVGSKICTKIADKCQGEQTLF